MAATNPLSRELQTYAEHLPELASETGKFALVHDGDVAGVFDTYEDALKVGYGKFKLAPFLVKQIAPSEQILSFTRDFQFAGN
jgi:hypothetical protein